MKYLLDTNICIRIMSDRFPAERAKLLAAALTSNIYVSSVVLFELWYGVSKSAVPAKSELRLTRFLQDPLEVLVLSEEDAKAAGRIRASLEAQKQPIGPYDTLIAGQALSQGLTLVTSNRREFARIHDLRWEDWSRSEF